MSVMDSKTIKANVDSYMTKLAKTAQIEKLQVCIVGSGNWGSTAAKIAGENILAGGAAAKCFQEEVRMWVFEEEVKQKDGSVRSRNRNDPYPGLASPDQMQTCRGLSFWL